jgi:predicted SnoaL-like aldol condensation-catalyzing enzyme
MQPIQKVNASGRTMLDGAVIVEDHAFTECNREKVFSFVNDILIERKLTLLANYVCNEHFIQHSPTLADGISNLQSALSASAIGEHQTIYSKVHRVLAEGNFVLSISEGLVDTQPSSFYDLFRLEQGKIIEHWDTVEPIPPRSEWKNDNGKF